MYALVHCRMPRKPCLSRKPKNWKRKRTLELKSIASVPFTSLTRQIQSCDVLPCGNTSITVNRKIVHDITCIVGWVVNNLCTEYIQVCKFRQDEPDTLSYSLKIEQDTTWLLFLSGQKVLQWTLANPNSLGPEPIQISEIFGLVKATAATCVIVTAPYLQSVLGSLGSLPLLHVHRTQNTAPKRSFSTLLIHRMRKT